MVQSMQSLSAPTLTGMPLATPVDRMALCINEDETPLSFEGIWSEIQEEIPLGGDFTTPKKTVELEKAQGIVEAEPLIDMTLAENLKKALINFFEDSDQSDIYDEKTQSISLNKAQTFPPISMRADSKELLEDIAQLYGGDIGEVFDHALVKSHTDDVNNVNSLEFKNSPAKESFKGFESVEVPEALKIIKNSHESTEETPTSNIIPRSTDQGFFPAIRLMQENKSPEAATNVTLELKNVNPTTNSPTVTKGSFIDPSPAILTQGHPGENLSDGLEGEFQEQMTFEAFKSTKDEVKRAENSDIKINTSTNAPLIQVLREGIQIVGDLGNHRAQMMTPTPQSQQLFVEVKKALDEGNDKITIKLTPASLGKVDIKIEVTHDGRSTVVIATERPETLDLFRKDASFLQASLSEMGLDLDLGESSFNLMESFDSNSNQHTKSSKSKDEGLPEKAHQLYQYMSSHRGLYQEFA